MSKMKQSEQVKTIMTVNPVSLTKLSKISEAANIFKEGSFHHLPVLSGNKLIGMFSYSDLLRINFTDSFGQDEREVLAVLDSSKGIPDVMSSRLTTVRETETIKDAAKILCEGKFHSLPVVNSADELVGMITSSDVIRYYAEL